MASCHSCRMAGIAEEEQRGGDTLVYLTLFFLETVLYLEQERYCPIQDFKTVALPFSQDGSEDSLDRLYYALSSEAFNISLLIEVSF